MRAYLRLDPNLPDHKGEYPDGPLAAFTMTLCLAEQQPQRGRFKSRKLLAVLLEKRARWIPYLIEHGDLIEEEKGRLYLDGWDEWQEGDVTVPERMVRLRNRKRNGGEVADTATVTPRVTVVGVTALSSGGGGFNGGLSRSRGGPPSRGLHDGQHPDCVVCHPVVVA